MLLQFPQERIRHARTSEGSGVVLILLDNSSRDRATPRSAASNSMGTCQRPGMPPRRSHISIAFGEILNLFASSSGPPTRATMSEGALINGISGTPCSENQEQIVQLGKLLLFQPRDRRTKTENQYGMAPVFRQESEISATALERLQELLADMRRDIEWFCDAFGGALDEQFGGTSGHKTVGNWFNGKRNGIPAGHIFNVAAFLGVDPRWLAGDPRVRKESLVLDRHGLYAELTRIGA